MAWTRKLPSGRYQGCYRDQHDRPRSAGAFIRKQDAQNAAAEEERRIRLGEWVDPALRRMPLESYAAQWFETKGNVKARTRINVEGRLANHILPMFGSTPLIQIEPVHVRAWVASLSATLAPSTVKATYRTLGQIMRTAHIDGLIPRNPCIGIDLPPETKGEEMHFLNPEQVAALAGAIQERYQAAIYCAAYTGMRAGELWGLKVERVNMLKRSLTVSESLSEVRGEIQTGPTKTGVRRSVSLPAFLVEILAEHMSGYSNEYVFSATDGGPVRHRNFMRRHFDPALERAGLPAKVRFHDLRHSCAAILIGEGWNPKQVQARLGHASIRTTLDRYGHLFDGHDAELLDGLDVAFRAQAEGRSEDSAAYVLHAAK